MAAVALISTQRWGAKIIGPPSNGYSVVTLPSSYVVVDGFDVSGGANGGYCIDGGYDAAKNHLHHLVVINNNVHDCGSGGIEFVGGDYYVIESKVAHHMQQPAFIRRVASASPPVSTLQARPAILTAMGS